LVADLAGTALVVLGASALITTDWLGCDGESEIASGGDLGGGLGFGSGGGDGGGAAKLEVSDGGQENDSDEADNREADDGEEFFLFGLLVLSVGRHGLSTFYKVSQGVHLSVLQARHWTR